MATINQVQQAQVPGATASTSTTSASNSSPGPISYVVPIVRADGTRGYADVAGVVSGERTTLVLLMHYLTPKEVASSERVSKQWQASIQHKDQTVWKTQCRMQRFAPNSYINRVEDEMFERASHTGLYKSMFSNSRLSEHRVITPQDWARFQDVGQVDPLPASDHQTIAALKQPCINGFVPPGLTTNRLIELMPRAFTYINSEILKKYGDQPAEGGYVSITRDFIPGTRGETAADGLRAIENYGQTPREWERPGLIEFLSLAAMDREISGELAYKQIYTYVQGDIGGDPLVVGGSARGGLYVYYDCGVFDSYGSGAMRKFKAIGT